MGAAPETAGEGPAPARAVVVRAATPADAAALARLHVRAWQWAYRGQLPDEVLDQLEETVPRREAWRRERLAREPGEERTWVAEDAAGKLLGFADTGPGRDADAPPDTAELSAIYLAPEVVGTGVGRLLHAHALADLARRGYRAATLWVLATNGRARRFYERAGWRPDGAVKLESLRGAELREVRYRIGLAAAAGAPGEAPGTGSAAPLEGRP